MNVEVHVRRKTRDLVCDAAADALRASCPEVAHLERADVWTFRVDTADAPEIGRVLAESTLVANPNVHRWAFAGEAAARPVGAGTRVRLRVHDRVDARGAAVLRAMRDRRGVASLTEVRHAVQWTIDIHAPRAAAEALARGLAGLSERGAGLLANPHAQDVDVAVEGQ
jgi:phosphoribosylformylglycinamidine (FGAM) synthase PurS component